MVAVDRVSELQALANIPVPRVHSGSRQRAESVLECLFVRLPPYSANHVVPSSRPRGMSADTVHWHCARHGWTAHPPRLQMVVVLDMGDVQPCEVGVGGCPQDGHFQFNTQVAFDQEGR